MISVPPEDAPTPKARPQPNPHIAPPTKILVRISSVRGLSKDGINNKKIVLIDTQNTVR